MLPLTLVAVVNRVATPQSQSANIVGKRLRLRREELGLSQEKVGVRIGIDESSSRARISRYELGTHEPPVETARLIAEALGVPLAYLYCDETEVAELLKKLWALSINDRRCTISQWQKGLE